MADIANIKDGKNLDSTPRKTSKAVSKVVHELMPVKQAYEMYNDLKSGG